MEQLKEEDILSLWIKNFSLIIAKYEMLIDNRLSTIDRWCISDKIGNGFADDGQFSCDKSDNIYMAKVMTLFVYIKLFESIVTVEGEEFLNSREEKECYKLVRESTKFIYDRLKEFSKYNCKTASDELNRHMRNMFKNMRSSLKEEVGSIKRIFCKKDMKMWNIQDIKQSGMSRLKILLK